MSKSYDSPISFASSEVSIYYGNRVPELPQTAAKQWCSGCLVHKGKDSNFSVEAATGMCRCFSTCDKGWDIIGLEEELTGAGFVEARDSVFRIVGREVPLNGSHSNSNGKGGSDKSPGKWQEIARYPYHNVEDVLIFEVVRYLKPDGKKTFFQCRPSGVEAAGTTDSGIRGGVPTGGIVNGLDAGRRVWVESQHTHDGT